MKSFYSMVVWVPFLSILLCGCMMTGSDGRGEQVVAVEDDIEVPTGYQPIQSDLIYSVNYDRSSHVLTVVLYEDGVYDYAEVPASVYESLLNAQDYDQYYVESIRSKYDGRKFSME